MTSKERIRAAAAHLPTDLIPADFECVPEQMEQLKQWFGCQQEEQVLELLGSDIRRISPPYIGRPLKRYKDSDGSEVIENFLGYCTKRYWNGMEYEDVPFFYPWDEIESIEELDQYPMPSMKDFDFSEITRLCDAYPDKAISIGCIGAFQISNYMRPLDKVLMDMVLEPEFAKCMFDKIVSFELEYYENMLIAGKGKIDILKCCDDYGTQNGLLFSTDMWREYIRDNTQKLVDLAHRYGALYHQHSCGAVGELIPDFIKCGVDILEPLQKVPGLEPQILHEKYGSQITFLGGIDTQHLLPSGSEEDVLEETRKIADIFSASGGYILMASQSFQMDVPPRNILAVYSLRNPSLRCSDAHKP